MANEYDWNSRDSEQNAYNNTDWSATTQGEKPVYNGIPNYDMNNFMKATATPVVAPQNEINSDAKPVAQFSSTQMPFTAPVITPKKEPKRVSWTALMVAMLIASLLGAVLGVGAIKLNYDQGRSVSFTENNPVVKPVVKSSATAPDWQEVAKVVSPATVAITARNGNSGAAGSGIIIDLKGHILTNDHVIANAKSLMVTLYDGRVFRAKVVGTDSATDLAVIALQDPPKDLTVAALGNSNKVVVGQPVAAIGNPLGLATTMTSGIVSALDRPVQTTALNKNKAANTQVVTNAIQLDAAVNPGNSGGAVFDAQGRVIGIASSIATTSQVSGTQGGSIGLGFAIPINLAKNISQQLIKNGVAEHAYLGVLIRDGVANYADATRLGAEIQRIEPNTPAAKAKLKKGDVVVAIDNRKVISAVSLTGYVRQYNTGDKVKIVVERGGTLREFEVTLATRKDL